jgi:hypothetical protein
MFRYMEQNIAQDVWTQEISKRAEKIKYQEAKLFLFF